MSDLTREEKWKIYEAGRHYIDQCNERQWDQDAKDDKWLLSLASGSFGLSFAFIGNVVPLPRSCYRELLITAWACFAAVFVLELCGFMVSSFIRRGV
jgi:hypothetical protein